MGKINSNVLKKRAVRGLLLLTVLFSFMASLVFAGEFAVFGPKKYVREKGKPKVVVDSFSVTNPEAESILHIQNGDDDKKTRVSSASIFLNGLEVVNESQFNKNVEIIEVPVTLEPFNTLEVELRSQPGSFLIIEITQEGAPGADITPPDLSITQPLDGSTITTTIPLIRITYSDDNSGVDLSSLNVLINGADKTSFFTVTDAQASFQVTEADPLPEGENSISASVSDLAGNPASALSTFTVSTGSPPITPTSGFIHGYVYDSRTDLPLFGAIITAKEIVGFVSSNQEGKFSFPTPDEGKYLLTITKEGYTYAQRWAEVVSTRDVLVDPIYLTPLDPQVTTITPDGGTATNSAGTLELVFPPGAVSESIDVIATQYEKPEELPSALPPNSIFTYAADFKPDDITFNQPVTLRVKNTLGFPVGTPIPIGFYNEGLCLGKWEPAGMGEVVGDGTWAEFTITHFSPYDCNLAYRIANNLNALTVNNNNTSNNNNSNKTCTLPSKSRVGIKTGDLYVDHSIPSTRALGASKDLILSYSSNTANPTVLFETETNIDDYSAASAFTSGYLLETEGIRKEIKYISTPGDARQAFLWDGRNGRGERLPTGSYPYKITFSNDFEANYAITNVFGGLPQDILDVVVPVYVPKESITSGRAIINNQLGSPFGAGWSLSGLQRLHPDPDGKTLLTDGDGSSLVFTQRAFAYVPNWSNNNVSVINTLTNTVVETISVGSYPYGVAITPDGRYVYVTNAGSNNVSVINTLTNTVVATVSVGWEPRGIAVTPDGRYVYVTNYWSKTISVIDTSENVVVSTSFLGGSYPWAVAVTPDGKYAYVVNRYSHDVSVINTSTNRLVTTVSVGSYPVAIAITPDSKYAYVVNQGNNNVSVIEVSANVVVGTISVGSGPWTIAITPDGRYAYVVNLGGGNLSVIDILSNMVVETIVAGSDPWAIAITPNGRFAYVTNIATGEVSVIDISICNTVVETVSVGSGPAGIAIISGKEDTFISPDGEFSELVRNENGTFIRIMKDGTKHYFNQEGLHASTVDRNGNTTTYAYDAQDRLISVTDPVGQVTTLTYSGDYLSSITDPAGRTTYFYHDGDGNLIQIVNPDGTSKSFTYNSNHLFTSKIDERGNISQCFYDKYGRISEVYSPEYEVLKDGQLTREPRISRFRPTDTQELINDLPPGVGTPSNPAPVVRPEDVRYEVEEGCCGTSTGRANKFGAVTEETDALGRTTNIDRDIHSNPAQTTRPNGAVTTMSYDYMGNLLSSTEQAIGATTSFTYEDSFNQVTSITDPNNNTTTLDYDDKGNPLKITDALGDTTTMTYDSRGLLTSTTDALGNTTTFDYDSKGNLVSTTDPLGNTTTLDYDLAGNVIFSTDALGRTTYFEYDPMNRLTKVIDADDERTYYGYDNAGNLTTITDAIGNTTRFEYNEMKQLTKIINPLGQEKSFYYDLSKNLARTIDPKSQVIDYSYDQVNRLIQKQLPDNAYAYTYDLVDNLTRLAENDSDLNFTYDLVNRLTQARTDTTTAQPGTTINYSYDKNGNRLTMSDPQGGATNYTYDALNRLISLTSPQSQTTNFSYDGLSRRINLDLPNGISTDYTYDAKSQLLTLNSQLSILSYSYDDVGNRDSMTDPDGLHNYTYDVLNRLTQATHPTIPTESFTYDPAGNRLGGLYDYDAANRLLEDDGFTYEYDANGNMISKTNKSTLEVTNYTYDAEDQLVRIDFPDGTYAAYSYDGLGRRIQKDINGVITRYIYDNEDIASELNAQGSVLATYIHGPGIDEPLAMQRDGETYYYIPDALGTIRALSGSDGYLRQVYNYDAFGNMLQVLDAEGNPISIEEAIPNPYAFTGREYDSESGLHYYRARHYDSGIGRFLQEDPIGLLGGINLFTYIGNNPINRIDPFGLRTTNPGGFCGPGGLTGGLGLGPTGPTGNFGGGSSLLGGPSFRPPPPSPCKGGGAPPSPWSALRGPAAKFGYATFMPAAAGTAGAGAYMIGAGISGAPATGGLSLLTVPVGAVMVGAGITLGGLTHKYLYPIASGKCP